MDGDPIGACNFLVDLGGEPVGVNQVLGLGYEPEQRLASPVTLRRAASSDLALWRWALKPEPRTVTITLLDARLEPACRYVLQGARPIKWTGPDLDANSSEVAMEELVLTSEGLELEGRR